MFVAEPRRDRRAFDAEFLTIVEELGNFLCVLALKQGAIDGDAEPARIAISPLQQRGRTRLLTNGRVVRSRLPSKCIEKVRWGRFVIVDAFLEQKRIGTDRRISYAE